MDWQQILMRVLVHSEVIPRQIHKMYEGSLWKLTVLCLLVNLISLSLYQWNTWIEGILLSALYIWIVIPLSWLFIFKRFYRAMQGNTSLGYLFWISLGMFLTEVLRSSSSYIACYQFIQCCITYGQP